MIPSYKAVTLAEVIRAQQSILDKVTAVLDKHRRTISSRIENGEIVCDGVSPPPTEEPR